VDGYRLCRIRPPQREGYKRCSEKRRGGGRKGRKNGRSKEGEGGKEGGKKKTEERDKGDGGKEERMEKGGEREETEGRRAKERRSRVIGVIDGEDAGYAICDEPFRGVYSSDDVESSSNY
jgi:hypothetical protein